MFEGFTILVQVDLIRRVGGSLSGPVGLRIWGAEVQS